ncbi:MAG TPA: zinc-finger-containing protein [Methylomusa anaerophila]|uniref:Uncharacterized protein n=1 Tax=Methylomusa anaerophila TaxID=1930071 RepID=A0A348AIY9_9FIRM|nr:zinc-finger-containing protein [Methylomusa anaerophila]BBB91037.1 hypothetical protein MAMMFC1_01705 [Methylomusa anaerophila]HML88906.1 zinc-finger-containing protein [Methylomusa anaerophila]
MNVICQYCGNLAIYTDSACIYGRSYGMVYYCKDCNAWVGVHKGTDKPLGILANAELRDWKIKAHASFDPLWKSGKMKRHRAYKWLAEQLGKPRNETHIGMFCVEDCKRVVEVCSGCKI